MRLATKLGKPPFAYPPIIGHWASSWHRPKADMPSQPASLRDVRTGDGSRRSRGLAGRVRRPPRRRHLSPTVRAASRPRAAGPRAGGAIRNARPGRSPSRWKSSAPYGRSAEARCAAKCVSDRHPKGRDPSGVRWSEACAQPLAKLQLSQGCCAERNRARSRPKAGRRHPLRSVA